MFRLSLNGLSTILSTYAGQRIVFRTRLDLLRHIQRLSADFHKKTPVGDMLYRIEQDVQMIEDLAGSMVVSVVRIAVTTSLTLAIMFILNWKLTLLVLPLLAVAIWTRRYGQPRLRKLSDDVQKTGAQRTSLLQEMLSSVLQIQLLRRETAEARRYAKVARSGIDLHVRRRGGELLLGLTNILVTVAGTALVLGYGGYQAATGVLTIGGLVAFYTFLSRLFDPIENITSMYSQYQRASASIRRVQQVLREKPLIRDDEDAQPLAMPARGTVELRDIAFGYEAERPILRDVSFSLGPGQSLAIIGPTGGGKSTIAHLITRFYDPQAGAVLLDGRDVRRLRLRDIRSIVAVVPQEPLLFNATLRENLLLARRRATADEIDEALHMAQLGETIARLPLGLEQPVGQRGGLLSGGERQRVAIARAILQRPRVLVLDEATSALDGPTEQRLLSALGAFGHDRTIIIVAHRLAPILWADRSLLLDEGRVIAAGRHDELFATSTRYREFLEQQIWRDPRRRHSGNHSGCRRGGVRVSWISSVVRWTRVTLGAVLVVGTGFFVFARVAITNRAPGEVEISAYQKVRPEVGGIISSVAVRSGETVAAGVPLFAVGDPQRELANQQTLRELGETRISLAAALHAHQALLTRIHPLERARQVNTNAQVRLEIMRAQARVQELRSLASVLESKYTRTRELHEQGVISKAELDQAKESADQAKWQLRQVEIEHEKSRLAAATSATDVDLVGKQQESALAESAREIEQLRALTAVLQRAMAEAERIRRLETVRSNIPGVVIGSEPRELVGKRVEPGEIVFSVVDPTAIRFRALVPEEDLVPVRPGQEAIIELAGLPKTKYRVFRGRVLTIDREPQRSAPGEQGVYAVVIAVEDPWVKTPGDATMYLPIGMRGTVRIISRPHVGLIEAVRVWITG